MPKLNIDVHFLAFFLAGGSLGPNESYYRSVFLIKLSFTNLVITVWPSPTVELFSQVYPVIQKTSACTVLLFQLWSLKNRKSIKKKTDRNCWYAWAPYNLSFLRMEKQRLRISAALNLAKHKISLTQDVIACRISAAVDVILCRISAALDVKACRIFARLGRQTLQNFCSIRHQTMQNFCSTGRQTLQNFCITVRNTMSNKNEKKKTAWTYWGLKSKTLSFRS